MFLKGPNIIKKLRQRSQCFYCTVVFIALWKIKCRHNLVTMIQGHHGMIHGHKMSLLGTLPHELSVSIGLKKSQ